MGTSTLKPEVLAGVDMIILRELTGGLYFGKPQGQSGEKPNRSGVDTMYYTEGKVSRLMRLAFELTAGGGRRSPRWIRRTCWPRRGFGARWPTGRGRISRRRDGGHPGGFLFDVSDPPAGRLRRDHDREHVRRHPLRRGRDAGGQGMGMLAGSCRVWFKGTAGVSASTSRSTAVRPISPVRASPTRWR